MTRRPRDVRAGTRPAPAPRPGPAARGGAATDAAVDGRRAARAMRGAEPPASYGEIAAALGVSRSTAYRWANPEAFEYDRIRSRKPGGRLATRDAARLHELRRRADPDRARCRRCGAGHEDERDETSCWRCRLVERHAAAARRILRQLDAGVDATPVALRTADPTLREVDVGLFLGQLTALGRLDAPEVTTDALRHRDVVQGLADARPTAIGDLDPGAREAAAVAAGCLVALRDEV